METIPEFEPLTPTECRALLRSQGIGRLGFLARTGHPLVYPLNYVWSNEAVVFRTAAGTRLGEAVMSRVAFEIDGFDEIRGLGWSVLVQGVLGEITDAIDPDSQALRRLAVQPLAPGRRERWMAVRPIEITGRRIRHGPGSLEA